MLKLLAHAGDDHSVETNTGLLAEILHQPTWLGLLMVVTLLLVIYMMANRIFKRSLATSLLLAIGACIVIGVLFLPHNPTVSGIVLSSGFVATFLLVFTLLGKHD